MSSVGEAHLKDMEQGCYVTLMKNINSLLPFLEQSGLKLVLEIHGEHAAGSILKEIVEGVTSEFVKINYDTANAIFYGKVDPVEDIDVCMGEIAYMHIKDKGGESNEWNCCLS